MLPLLTLKILKVRPSLQDNLQIALWLIVHLVLSVLCLQKTSCNKVVWLEPLNLSLELFDYNIPSNLISIYRPRTSSPCSHIAESALVSTVNSMATSSKGGFNALQALQSPLSHNP